eukprot:gene27661-36473_t
MTSFFSSISRGIQLVQQKVTEDATFLNDKISRSALEAFDPGKAYGILWEKAENVQYCRSCENNFPPLLISKHHCRSCAGVFCDDCCPLTNVEGISKFYSTLIPNYEDSPGLTSIRICDACSRGECPGMPIKEEIRARLEAMTSKDDSIATIKNFVSKVTLGGLTDGADRFSTELKIAYGSCYGEDGKPTKAINRPLPVSGYFEIHNKSNQVFCIKVLMQGVDVKFEIPRPSYKAVPPKESAYAFFYPDRGNIEILILHGNPNPIEEHQAISYNTAAPGMRADRISKCAKVGLFSKISYYSCSSAGKNVLLKYRGDGAVQPRTGNSISRIGILPRLQGRRYAPQKIDFSTNIDAVKLEFEISVELTRFYKQPQSAGTGSSRFKKMPVEDPAVVSSPPKRRVS